MKRFEEQRKEMLDKLDHPPKGKDHEKLSLSLRNKIRDYIMGMKERIGRLEKSAYEASITLTTLS